MSAPLVNAPRMNSRTRWLLLALAGLALVGFLVSGGHDRAKDAPSDKEDAPVTESVSFPMPEREQLKRGVEAARGLYVLRTADRTLTLDLQRGSRFKLLIAPDGKPARELRGTWSLVGERLTMAYKHVPGRPQYNDEKPLVVTNTWRGSSIEMAPFGTEAPAVLRKRTAIRQH